MRRCTTLPLLACAKASNRRSKTRRIAKRMLAHSLVSSNARHRVGRVDKLAMMRYVHFMPLSPILTLAYRRPLLNGS